jgi:hypothetical protein
MKRIPMPNGFMVVSDAHLIPGERLATLAKARQYCDTAGTPLIYNGDMKDILLLGVDCYGRIDPHADYAICGNHEGKLAWYKKTEKGNKRTKFVNKLDIDVHGTYWHVEHGDAFTLDWGLFRPVLTVVAWIGLTFFKKRWSKWCLKHWSPKEAKQAGETGKWKEMTGFIHETELRWCKKHKTNGVFGHTHYAEIKEDGVVVADCGDARDGQAVIVDKEGKARLHTFNSI